MTEEGHKETLKIVGTYPGWLANTMLLSRCHGCGYVSPGSEGTAPTSIRCSPAQANREKADNKCHTIRFVLDYFRLDLGTYLSEPYPDDIVQQGATPWTAETVVVTCHLSPATEGPIRTKNSTCSGRQDSIPKLSFPGTEASASISQYVYGDASR